MVRRIYPICMNGHELLGLATDVRCWCDSRALPPDTFPLSYARASSRPLAISLSPRQTIHSSERRTPVLLCTDGPQFYRKLVWLAVQEHRRVFTRTQAGRNQGRLTTENSNTRPDTSPCAF